MNLKLPKIHFAYFVVRDVFVLVVRVVSCEEVLLSLIMLLRSGGLRFGAAMVVAAEVVNLMWILVIFFFLLIFIILTRFYFNLPKSFILDDQALGGALPLFGLSLIHI